MMRHLPGAALALFCLTCSAGFAANTLSPAIPTEPAQVLVSSLRGDDAAAARKLYSELQYLYAISQKSPRGLVDVSTLKLNSGQTWGEVYQRSGADPIVDITVAGDVQALADALRKQAGVRVLGVAETPAYGLISAAISPARLLDVARHGEIRAMHGSQMQTGRMEEEKASASPAPRSQGSADNQAEKALKVEDLRAIFLGTTNGTGIDVGTLSDSADTRDAIVGDGFVGIDESQNTADLPADARINIVAPAPGTFTDEGRAMMEHIYDIAPSVGKLGFATAKGGEATFAANITALGAAGMDIINDDVVYFAEPIFQDGVIAQAVNTYVDGGGIYFSLNHNYGTLSRQDTWTDVGNNNFHEYGGGSEFLPWTIAGNTGTINVFLFWDEPWGNAATDFELEAWDNSVNPATLQFASNDANVGGNPFDAVGITGNGSLSFRIRYNGGASPAGRTLKIIAFDNGISRFTFDALPNLAAGTLTPHAGTPKSIAIGAAPFFDVDTAENFSGRGPFMQFFDNAGNRFADAPRTYQKPDFLSIDKCNTSFFGGDIAQDADALPNFSGTSAATPNAAAVAALMLQQAGGSGSLTQEDVRRLLRLSSVDVGDAGHDTTNGFGRINAVGAVSAARGPFNTSVTYLYPNQFGNVTDSTRTLDNFLERENYVVAFDTSGNATFEATEGTDLNEIRF